MIKKIDMTIEVLCDTIQTEAKTSGCAIKKICRIW